MNWRDKLKVHLHRGRLAQEEADENIENINELGLLGINLLDVIGTTRSNKKDKKTTKANMENLGFKLDENNNWVHPNSDHIVPDKPGVTAGFLQVSKERPGWFKRNKNKEDIVVKDNKEKKTKNKKNIETKKNQKEKTSVIYKPPIKKKIIGVRDTNKIEPEKVIKERDPNAWYPGKMLKNLYTKISDSTVETTPYKRTGADEIEGNWLDRYKGDNKIIGVRDEDDKGDNSSNVSTREVDWNPGWFDFLDTWGDSIKSKRDANKIIRENKRSARQDMRDNRDPVDWDNINPFIDRDIIDWGEHIDWDELNYSNLNPFIDRDIIDWGNNIDWDKLGFGKERQPRNREGEWYTVNRDTGEIIQIKNPGTWEYPNQKGIWKGKPVWVPADNKKQLDGKGNLVPINAASKGQGGDTKISVIDGEVSHVNETEKYLVDNFGDFGQIAVQQIGSGTINPETGLKEYTSQDIITQQNVPTEEGDDSGGDSGGSTPEPTPAPTTTAPVSGTTHFTPVPQFQQGTNYMASIGSTIQNLGGLWENKVLSWGGFGITAAATLASAKEQADANERELKNVEEAIANLQGASDEVGGQHQADEAVLQKNLESTSLNMNRTLSSDLDKLATKMGNTIRKSKGLHTSSIEQSKDIAQQSISSSFDASKDKLMQSYSTSQRALDKQYSDEMSSIAANLEMLEDRKEWLQDNDSFWEVLNPFG